LRQLYADDSDYESFTLPYCFRCPEVVVTAVNDVIKFASERGLLDGHVDKQYKYAASRKKDAISTKFEHIVHEQCNETAICAFIERELRKIVKEEDDNFDVLVISPFRATNFQRRLLAQLRRKDEPPRVS
jgi:hypothetical protein